MLAVVLVGLGIVHIDHRYGGSVGAVLLILECLGAVAFWWLGYDHRVKAGQELVDMVRYQQHQLANVAEMTGAQFERYCAMLLETRGYRQIKIIGRGGDGGIDILAVAPDGARVAVQCKRWKMPVGPGVVRELIGSLTSGYQQHAGILMTSSRVTDDARNEAGSNGIEVVDKEALLQWMAEARSEIERKWNLPPQSMKLIQN
jgi:restriction system protein